LGYSTLDDYNAKKGWSEQGCDQKKMNRCNGLIRQFSRFGTGIQNDAFLAPSPSRLQLRVFFGADVKISKDGIVT
jgi:hypothetical protein